MASVIETSLPEMVLEPGTTITVEADDPDTVITQLNVYGFTPSSRASDPLELLPPILTFSEVT